ncbi:MAG: PAS domain S-box protein [Pyrinomonadaceae bacterium]
MPDDIRDRRRTDQRLAILYGITRLVAEKAPTDNLAPDILRLLCESFGWQLGALWRVEKDAGFIRCLDVWHQPFENATEFEEVTRRITFLPGEGLPGTVWQNGDSLWIDDFSQTFNFPRAHSASRSGLKAAVCFPLLLRSEVTGVIEFFSHDIRSPDHELIELMAAVGNQIAQLLERGQIERARRESEDRFRTLADTASDGIINVDESSTILFVNPAAGRIFGYTVEEMAGQSLTMLMPDYLRHLHQSGIKRFVETGERHISWHGIELPGLHKSGEEIPLEISFGESQAEGKHFFTGIVRDISGRKRSEALLRESEKRYRTMADTAPVLIWEAGTDKLRSYFNKPWLDFTGRTMEEEIGEGWVEGVHPDDVERCLNTYSSVMNVRGNLLIEYRLRRADGEYRWIVDQGVPRFVPDGSFVGYIGSCLDISERKQAEEERIRLLESEQDARRKAEEASRLKDEFLATVSHELRTPLTAVLGWAHMLAGGQLDQKRTSEALEAIARNARSQTQLIDDLLDVSRIITGRLSLDVTAVDVATVIDEAIEAVRPAAEAKGVRIQRIVDTGVGSVAGDEHRLRQIVWNLLSNAIKFTSKKGRVQIRLQRVNSSIEIAVSDSGIGISPEFLPYVFDRFRQADMSTTRQHSGLGLGLAIVRHLTELHGGTAYAESAGEGQGSTFTIRLPLVGVYQNDNSQDRVHPAAKRLNPPPDCPERLDNLKVLVVDDEADTRQVLLAMLGQCGAEVITADSTATALLLLEQMKPDVLVSDIGMPVEDGYELIRKVRALPEERGGGIPAVALTAYARPEDRLRTLRAGYQMHIPKPVEIAELVAILANVAGRYRKP